MTLHVARQGDYLDLVAWRYGVSSAQIWDHPDNSGLRAQRGEGNVLKPGDVLFVPEAQGEPLTLTKGQGNAYVARVPLTSLKVRLSDGAAPMAGEAFTVDGPTPQVTGTTDGNGVASFDVPMNCESVMLRVPGRGRALRIDVGHLDPASEESGVRTRLSHLGYLRRGDDPNAQLALALTRFQESEGLEPTGEIDETTRSTLAQRHGS